MSFINLMANDIWPDADITRRTEAMVRTEFSLEAETILNRKVAGISLGQYTPTDADLDEMARFKVVVDDAQAAGVAARADMALLLDTMAYETAMKRLAQPLPPEDATDEEKAQDAAERAAAQSVVDAASQQVIDLYELRNPPVIEPVTLESNQNEVPTGE